MDTSETQGPVEDSTLDLADEIVRVGRAEVNRAEETSAKWAKWAVRVHQLIEDMPSRMDGRLTQVLRDADAIVGAWRRAAVDVLAQSHMALRAVNADEQHFVRLQGGEARG